eukprot:14886996-Ditylum_brightwellii.AAC.1
MRKTQVCLTLTDFEPPSLLSYPIINRKKHFLPSNKLRETQQYWDRDGCTPAASSGASLTSSGCSNRLFSLTKKGAVLI